MERVNFLKLPPERSSLEGAAVGILPIPLENTTGFAHGTQDGAAGVLRASQHLETWDWELSRDPSSVGIVTFKESVVRGLPNKEALPRIQSDVERVLKEEVWPLMIGGERTLSLATWRALKGKYPGTVFLQLDAQAQARQSFDGATLSRATIVRRLREEGAPLVLAGVRAGSEEESQWLRDKKIPLFSVADLAIPALRKELFAHIKGPVHLSLNMNVLDPALAPGVCAPEPAGLTWEILTLFLKELFLATDVVGAELCEVRSLRDDARTELLAAKLLYRLIALKFP